MAENLDWYFAYKIKEKLGKLTKEEKRAYKEAVEKVDKMKEKIKRKKDILVEVAEKTQKIPIDYDDNHLLPW